MRFVKTGRLGPLGLVGLESGRVSDRLLWIGGVQVHQLAIGAVGASQAIGLVGVIQFPDVFAHLLLLIRMSAEHGLSYAICYERDLHYELQSLTRSSQKFHFSDLLQRPLRRLTHKLDIKHYQSQRSQPSEPPPTKDVRKLRPSAPADAKAARPTQPGSHGPVCFKHDHGVSEPKVGH